MNLNNSISSLGQIDLQPLLPLITARGRGTKQIHPSDKRNREYDWLRRICAAELILAARDYSRGKTLAKRFSVTTENIKEQPKWVREYVCEGEKAYSWMTDEDDGFVPLSADQIISIIRGEDSSMSQPLTFQVCCEILGFDYTVWREFLRLPSTAIALEGAMRTAA